MTQPNISATKDLTINRNNIDIVFTPMGFKRGPLKEEGIKYPGFEVTDEETLLKAIHWHGLEDFIPWFNAKNAQLHQQVWKAATDEGKKDWSAEDNATMLEKLSTRGESRAVIDSKVKALIADLNNPDLLKAMAVPGDGQTEALGKFMKISADLKKFSDILESKKRVRTGDEDDDATENQPVTAQQ